MSYSKLSMHKVRVVLAWVVGTLAVGFCLSAAVKYWGEFTQYHTELSLAMLSLGLACTLLGSVTKGAGWFVLMSGLGSPIRFLTALRAYSYSQVASWVPGKLPAFLVRLQACKEDDALPSKVFGAMALEIVLSLTSALTIWLLSWLLTPSPDGLSRMGYLILLILMLAMLHPKVIMTLMGWYYRWRGASWEQEVPHMKLADIFLPGGLYFLGWLLYGFGGYFVLRSIVPSPTGPLASPVYVAGVFTFAWAVGYLIFIVPGGLGVREGVLIWMLGEWMPASTAVVVSLFVRLCFSSLGLLLAATWWVVHHARKARG